MTDNKTIMLPNTNLTLQLPEGMTVEVISLNTIKMTALEYVEGLFKSGAKPSVIAMNNSNLDLVLSGIEDRPKTIGNDLIDNQTTMGGLMSTRISLTELMSDDNIAVYTRPPINLSFMGELQQLLNDAGIDHE